MASSSACFGFWTWKDISLMVAATGDTSFIDQWSNEFVSNLWFSISYILASWWRLYFISLGGFYFGKQKFSP
jgi:hypothetical protein